MNTDLLVYQAKSFYNAYIALEQLSRADTEAELLCFVPMIVNGAFSVELTLKAILMKNQIKYEKEHNLYLLFQMLPESFQKEIVAHLVEKAPEYEDPAKRVEELILLSNAFVDWRYAFEERLVPAIESRFLAAFANAAIWTMFSHYNVDLITRAKAEMDDEIDQKIRANREKCKAANLKMIQKKNKEHHE